ncbi:uncharacterized protein J3R85_009214 [Psidium guajava]|nr:uncharacterized protein J3R85_009214 [Psidium guajava]
MASTRCPIEMEPRTLREGQLNHAREVAADVIQKMEPDKATSIFTEGLKPISPMKDTWRPAKNGEEVDGEPIECKSKGRMHRETLPVLVRVGVERISGPTQAQGACFRTILTRLNSLLLLSPASAISVLD